MAGMAGWKGRVSAGMRAAEDLATPAPVGDGSPSIRGAAAKIEGIALGQKGRRRRARINASAGHVEKRAIQ
jgi:hypothetical protein